MENKFRPTFLAKLRFVIRSYRNQTEDDIKKSQIREQRGHSEKVPGLNPDWEVCVCGVSTLFIGLCWFSPATPGLFWSIVGE